ncbi:MAG: hypothetical protein NTZ21_09965 [Actinobacteria bacterium]|nr:hypothetical protein [Actinomycetota bacterium]
MERDSAPISRRRSVWLFVDRREQRSVRRLDIVVSPHRMGRRPGSVDIGEPPDRIVDDLADRGFVDIGLRMPHTLCGQIGATQTEAIDRHLRLHQQHHLDERGTMTLGHRSELIDEVAPPHVLRHHHIVPRCEMGLGEREGEPTGDHPRFLPFGPPTQVRPQIVDVDHQRQRVIDEEAASERRLPRSRCSIDVDETSDTPV